MSAPPLSAAISVAIVLTGGISMDALGRDDSPRPHHESTLTENETAGLWSGDPDDGTTTGQSPYDSLAAHVDLTYAEPPSTAARWNAEAFGHFEGRDPKTSFAPDHAEQRSGRFIADAHITLFAVHPSTRVHRTSADRPLYIGPDGSVRAFVDYRVDLPDRVEGDNVTRGWSLADHRIVETELLVQGRRIDVEQLTHTPELVFDGLSGAHEFTLEATVEVEVLVTERTERTTCSTPPDSDSRPREHGFIEPTYPGAPDGEARTNESTTDVVVICTVTVEDTTTTATERLTVRDSVDVVVDDLGATTSFARYPNGTERVSIEMDGPWRALSSDDASFRTRWRFYTARDRRWDELHRTTEAGSKPVENPLRPVYVHAFTSVHDPASTDPNTLSVNRRSGTTVDPPDDLGEGITVDQQVEPYESEAHLTLRVEAETPLTLSGLVRDVTQQIERPPADTLPEIRSTITEAEVVNEPKGGATIEISVVDARTGESIAEFLPLDELGYVEIAGHRVPLDSTGSGRIWIQQPGAYTATYHPPSDPSVQQFESSSDTLRWHPLHSVDGLGTFGAIASEYIVPLTVAGLVGRWAFSTTQRRRRR